MEKLIEILQIYTKGFNKIPTARSVNPFHRIRVFLQPAMSLATRVCLDRIERAWATNTLRFPQSAYWFLVIVRSAFDTRQAQNFNVRQGINELLKNVIRRPVEEIIKTLNNRKLMLAYQVMQSTDRPMEMSRILTQYLRGLHHPLGLREQRAFDTLVDRVQREAKDRESDRMRLYKNRRLEETRKRAKLKEEREKEALEIAEAERLRKKRLAEQNDKKVAPSRKAGYRWLA